MDESGIEPETSPMLRERATDYATRPNLVGNRFITGSSNTGVS